MKSWLVIIFGLVSTWCYLDLSSDSRFYSLFLPGLFFLLLLAAVIKLAVKLGPEGSGGGSDGGFGGFDGGGDSCGGD